ncbi:MAG: non-homologous end-joining DNA ligase [bacterium]|jgi:bifunctional non-homologous end joining protein LigD
MPRRDQTVLINDRQLILSNLDKTLWPEAGFTKATLLQYYAKIYPYLAPYLKDRPLVVTRWPDGITGKHFYQKNAPSYAPEWVETFTIDAEGGGRRINYIICNNLETLLWLGNLACLELHPWLSTCQRIDYPSFLVFDLDPSGEDDFPQVREIALLMRELLLRLGLESYPKTSGATGMHIYVPLAPIYSYAEVRQVGERIATMLVKVVPNWATIERSVKQRRGKVYLDYMQNVRGQTLCAPYSPRPRAGGTVSTPLTWDEVPTVLPGKFTIISVLERAQRMGDLFAPVLTTVQTLEQAQELLAISLATNTSPKEESLFRAANKS